MDEIKRISFHTPQLELDMQASALRVWAGRGQQGMCAAEPGRPCSSTIYHVPHEPADTIKILMRSKHSAESPRQGHHCVCDQTGHQDFVTAY